VDYKLFLNALGLVIFAAFFWLTARRGATDPVCGMKVDRQTAVRSGSLYFCSEHCRHEFEQRRRAALSAGAAADSGDTSTQSAPQASHATEASRTAGSVDRAHRGHV